MTRYKAISFFALVGCFLLGLLLAKQQYDLIQIESQTQETIEATRVLLEKSVHNFETLQKYFPEIEAPEPPAPFVELPK